MRRILFAPALFLVAGASVAVSPEPAISLSQVASSAESVSEVQAPLGSASHQALAQGREIYKDLQRARHAAVRRDLIDVRLALNDARRVLNSFDEPAAARALRRQSALIRRDLASEGDTLKPGLWLPLEAELDDALISAPTQHIDRAKQAARAGKAAAAKGDRHAARRQVALLEDVLDYRWGLLPLSRMRGDVHSAEMALNPNPPYWQGVEQALRSALEAVRWITVSEAKGWLSAYETAVDARLLLPANASAARAALQRTAANLSGLPNAVLLAKDAHRLAAQSQPSIQSVEALVRGLKASLPGVDQS
jgi:hypothetical protein